MSKRAELAEAAHEVLDYYDDLVQLAIAQGVTPRASAQACARRLRELLDDPVSDEERAFDIGELATRWGVSKKTVRGLVETGELRAVDVAGATVPRWRVFERWVRDFERTRSNLPTIRRRAGSRELAGPGRFRKKPETCDESGK